MGSGTCHSLLDSSESCLAAEPVWDSSIIHDRDKRWSCPYVEIQLFDFFGPCVPANSIPVTEGIMACFLHLVFWCLSCFWGSLGLFWY